ncbi:MAG TPA: aminopeptidase [Dyella sp.]|nr:aminopeptidase [Dyella sp.]
MPEPQAHRTTLRRLCRLGAVLLIGAAASGCASVRYYGHVARGQLQILSRREPLAEVIADPGTPDPTARRLTMAMHARTFASAAMKLPDNRSYTSYVALDRPYVAWNVFAAPRFAVEAVPQCFPFAGCVAYRGYFRKSLAEQRAAQLRGQGLDVWVGPVPAYSTLGWFADPILSSMMRWDDDELAGTIFHELAHQRVYAKGDTAFNESFATFVEREGVREWRQSRGLPPPAGDGQAIEAGFTARVLELRERLRADYARGGGEAALQARKRADIAAFRRDYAVWRDREFPGDHRYDAWVAAPINNARLLPFGLYDRWTGAFAALFRDADRQWEAFYRRVRELAQRPPAARRDALQALEAQNTAQRRPAGERALVGFSSSEAARPQENAAYPDGS